MSEISITVEGGTSRRLLTAGKYCDRDIVVTATGGGGASFDGIPAGYARCDYIYFDGAQIIDTGIICNENTKIQAAFSRERSSQHYMYGVTSADNKASVTAYLGGSWRFGDQSISKKPIANADMIYSAIVDKTQISMTDNTTTISDVNKFETVGTLIVGGTRSSSGAVGSPQFVGKIYYFVIWQGEDQALKLIPVVSEDGVYRFFDQVSKTFFDSITDTPLDGGNV